MPIYSLRMNSFRAILSATPILLASMLFRCTSTESEVIAFSQLLTDSGTITHTGFHLAQEYDQGIRPSRTVEFWEERIMDDLGNTRVNMASVDSCAFRSIPCQGPLNAYRSSEGESQQNMPGPPFIRYFIGWTGSEVVVWNDKQALQSFLLPIDSEGDAELWALHNGYGPPYYSNSQSLMPFWIRTHENGYEMIGERMVNMCHPMHVIEVRFELQKSGGIRELARRTVVNNPDICILN